jgi:hypothetical protein
VIGEVMRGRRTGGLLRYLYGPGRGNKHEDRHLVASWDDDPVASSQRCCPRAATTCAASRLLEQPVAAAVRAPERPVWHCAVRTARVYR